LELIVQIIAARSDRVLLPGVSFNGSWPIFEAQLTDELLFPVAPFTHHKPEYQAFNFRFSASEVNEGWNEITVYNGSRQPVTLGQCCDYAIHIESVELAVHPTA
jgi:hypothetical protein